MEKLNICLMNDSFPPVIDGVANVVLNYATILQKNYGTAIVATPEYPNARYNYPFEVLRYPSVDTTKILGYVTGMPFDVQYISQFNNRHIDILHTHCPATSLFLARTLRNSIHKPIIMTYHTKYDIEIRKLVNSELIQKATYKALVDNIEACDEIWTVSKGAGENLRSLGFTKDYIVMPNGVDFERGKSSKEEIESIRNQYHLSPQVPTYLFVGRMMWYKGLRIIIDALVQKKEKDPNFKMLFVGDGKDIQEVKNYVHECHLDDHCIFAGSISDRKVLKAIFSTCDLFLFPSTFDTNGIVVREAASSALATVLVKGSCAAEDTIDHQNVIWIEENANSLAKVLIEGNTDYYHRIGENAMNELYISWEESIDQAYQRYQYVTDHYAYPDEKRITLDPVENFMGTLADLSVGLTKIDDFQDSLEKQYEESIAELEHHIETLDRNIKYIRNKIERDGDEIITMIKGNEQKTRISVLLEEMILEAQRIRKEILDRISDDSNQ